MKLLACHWTLLSSLYSHEWANAFFKASIRAAFSSVLQWFVCTSFTGFSKGIQHAHVSIHRIFPFLMSTSLHASRHCGKPTLQSCLQLLTSLLCMQWPSWNFLFLYFTQNYRFHHIGWGCNSGKWCHGSDKMCACAAFSTSPLFPAFSPDNMRRHGAWVSQTDVTLYTHDKRHKRALVIHGVTTTQACFSIMDWQEYVARNPSQQTSFANVKKHPSQVL